MIISKINCLSSKTLAGPSMSLKIVWQTTHKRQDWTVPHPNRLNCFISKQRTRRCYIQKTRLSRSPSQQTEPFPIWTENSALLHRKRQKLNRGNPRTKDKTEPFPISTDWTVSHLNTELDVVTSKKTKRIRSTSQQIDPFPIWAESSTLLHRKRQDRTVPHPNRVNHPKLVVQ